MHRLLRKLLWLSQRRRKNAELDDELAFHLSEDADEARPDGFTDEQARARARRAFGSVALIAEDTRAAWGWPRLESVLRDVRFGFRLLRKHPAFSIVAILTLAVAIGANTAVYTVVDR